MDFFPGPISFVPALPRSREIPPVNPPSPAPVVFCVDDDADDRRLFAELLARTGLRCRCERFATGGDLLEALLGVLKGAPPPLVCFVDVRMSGMGGFDVLRWIRCQAALDSLPVVMLSGSDDPEKLSEAHCSGAQCYVAKFPAVEHLREIICEAQRFSAARSTDLHFQLPCNLLLMSVADAREPRPTV